MTHETFVYENEIYRLTFEGAVCLEVEEQVENRWWAKVEQHTYSNVVHAYSEYLEQRDGDGTAMKPNTLVVYKDETYKVVRTMQTQFGPCVKITPKEGGRVIQVFQHQIKEVK